MQSTKASDRHPLDELLGVDPRDFDEDELTQVLDREEPDAALGSHPITEPFARLGARSEPSPAAPSAVSPVTPLGHDTDELRDSLSGTFVDARYRVLHLLGTGGIGLVYLCQHELLQKPVAMKVLRPEYVSHQDLNERFLIEARAATSIKSPRIVDVIDVGTLPNGAPYFVMEYVEGETLAALLDREGVVELHQTVAIAQQVAEGLVAAHAAGVIHRDLKPENVFLARTAEGELFAKLFDFGIAKVAGQRKRLTYVGAVFGTPTYMSPEQARGEAVDARADIYALGIMTFEMLAGAVPFDGEDPLAIMAQHVDRIPPPLSSVSRVPVPPSLEAIVTRCLEKDPAARFPNALALVNALSAVRLDEPAVEVARTPAPPPSPETLHVPVVSSAPRQHKKRARRWGWGFVAAALVTAGSVAAWTHSAGKKGLRSPSAAFGLSKPASQLDPALPRGRSDASKPETTYTEVHLVLSPLDARVYKGDQDLGQMPVSVRVQKGKPLTLTVRRKGFSSRRVVVDGSESRIVVGLVKSADTEPRRQTANRSAGRADTAAAAARSSPAKRTPSRQPADR